ncbi:Ubiquitin-specific-processing protease 8 [Hyphodiscus hymeniophilus]|uniref:Ubiquitin-specific-processing protease 8 n=1 Tax=Hyphodiscus hymeniophilus TaxID=353542 RepID=A0A9P7AWC4_9HELO|nr:Ubiquitin-specific-processing protease 8 [Hyphodiscus hymeniophilus]
MSSSGSLKRPHDDDDCLQPFKKAIIEIQDPVFDDFTKRTESSLTTSEIGLYNLRRRIANSVDVVAENKTMISKVKNDWSEMPTIAQKGMENFTGAICYRLSLLQALIHQTLFVHFLLDLHRPEHCVSDSIAGCVACSLRLLVLEYWKPSSARSGISKVLRGMHAVFSSLGWAADVWSGHADPEDQLTWIMNILESELPSSPEADTYPGHQDFPLAIDIFQTIKDPDATLATYLERYMVEKLSDYRCDGCQDATKEKDRIQLITQAPEILAIQIKRIDPITKNKIKNHVNIDPILNLNFYRDSTVKDQLIYELNAVIKHRGDEKDGHYIAFARGPDGVWSQYDDSRRFTCTLATATSSMGDFTPYLMCYQRK